MSRLRWPLSKNDSRVIPFADAGAEAAALPRLHRRIGEAFGGKFDSEMSQAGSPGPSTAASVPKSAMATKTLNPKLLQSAVDRLPGTVDSTTRTAQASTMPARGLSAALLDCGGDSPLPPETCVTPSVSRKTTRFAITSKDLVEDADSTVHGTWAMLEKSGALAHLCYGGEELMQHLTRPTPQLVHRVALAIAEVSGYLSWIPTDWPDDYNTKLDLFWEIRIHVSFSLRLRPLDVVPLDILRCRKRDQTRWLLQLMCIASIREQEARAAGESLSVQSDDSPMSSLMSRASSCYSVKSDASIGSPTTAAARRRMRRVMSSYDLVTPRHEEGDGGFSPTVSISRWRSRGSLGSVGTPTSDCSPTWSAWSARTPARSHSFFMTNSESVA